MFKKSDFTSIDAYERYIQNQVKDLDYWKGNASEDYPKTPISVLKYIGKLEGEIKEKQKLPNSDSIRKRAEMIATSRINDPVRSYVEGAEWMKSFIF